MRGLTNALKRGLSAAGLLGAARRLRAPFASAEMKRGRLDDTNLRLLASFALAVDANCIDVGSHEGSFLREAIRVAPNGKHIAYEPIPEFAARLVRNFPGVDVRAKAASDHSGTSSFAYVRTTPSMSGLRRRSYPGEQDIEELQIEIEAIDDALPLDYVPALIKIDVEGAELGVMQGAIKTLRRHHPIVAFEHGIGGADHYGTRSGDVYRLLCDDAGMRIFDIDGNGPYSLDEFERMFSRPDIWNFVAHL